jgi:sn-glycerol 3-phosphate transport system ATP-binding protein
VADIKVNNLTKSWGAATAVDGEFVALLGPSGCGKSTTLRLIAGLEATSAGRVVLAGRDVTALPASKRNLSMVFQSYALFPHLNVAGNVTFGLSVRGVPKAEQTVRLKRVADLLGLSALLDRRPSELSGGQQQRVALGRALIAETPICLLDEPLSNLDAQLRSEMRNEIRSLQQRLGITMVFVTHDQTEAMSMADRVILMRQGRIEQNGAPSDLYERPETVAVAKFIGTPPMNVIALTAGEGGGSVSGSGGPALAPPSARPLLLGVRPEHITIGAEGLPATVETTEYFGADSIIACRLGSERMLVRVPGQPGFAKGAQLRLSWASKAVHFFDLETGKRSDIAA